MKFNYTLHAIKIKSSWFDDLGRKKNIYQKITYKGLYLYLQLYKFRLHNQQNEHTFITSISLLRKETGYSSEEIFYLLKKMKSAKIINLENLSRYDYLLDENGKILDKNLLVITATDAFSISNLKNETKDFYIYIPLDLLDLYKKNGLNERYIALYCLIKKWSNNSENKMWMSIQKMAKVLEFDKDYVNKMIYELNRHYFLSSYRRKKNDGAYYYEHFILDSAKEDKRKIFLKQHKGNIDRLVKRIEKKKKSKKSINIEQELEIIKEKPKLAFETKNK